MGGWIERACSATPSAGSPALRRKNDKGIAGGTRTPKKPMHFATHAALMVLSGVSQHGQQGMSVEPDISTALDGTVALPAAGSRAIETMINAARTVRSMRTNYRTINIAGQRCRLRPGHMLFTKGRKS